MILTSHGGDVHHHEQFPQAVVERCAMRS